MKIKLKNIKKSYNDRIVLDIDELVFESGRIYAILGHNGSGKTTMLRLMAGIDKPDCGDILFENKKECTADMAYLPQNPYIFDLTAVQNVMVGMVKRADAFLLAEEALSHVDMKKFSRAGAHSLSGGESRRITVARTLVLEKSLVLLDEPTTFVDASSIQLVEDYIMFVNKKNSSTVIFSTHNPAQALRMADYVILLQDGRVMEKGDPEYVLCKKR